MAQNAKGAGVMLSLKALAKETILSPRSAAEKIIGYGLPAKAVWTALALVVVLNAMIYALTSIVSLSFIAPEMLDTLMGDPMFRATVLLASQPWLYGVLLVAAMVISATVLVWIGQMMGGQARLMTMLPLIVWLQGLRAAAQLVVLGLVLILPGMADLVSLLFGLYGLWILVNFIDVSQGWRSLGKSMVTMFIAGFGFMFGLSLFLLLIGAGSLGL